MSACPHRVQFPDSCEACEAQVEEVVAQMLERRAASWVERGERWQEDVIYGEIR